MSDFKINTGEGFPHLRNAPIREALIDFRARARIPWNEETVRSALQPKLSDYPHVEVNRSMVVGFMVKLDANTAEATNEQSWKGLQFKSAGGHRAAKFDRDGFTFSRLAPYQDWEDLEREALRLWNFHVDAADPDKIVRIGLRFINRLDLPPEATVDMKDFLPSFPTLPSGLESLEQAKFLHIDNFQVPNYSYSINVAKTLERGAQNPEGVSASWGVILDIDVATFANVDVKDVAQIKSKLAEMRWLKNKVFFGTISEKCKSSYL